jgi:hypothetical protein
MLGNQVNAQNREPLVEAGVEFVLMDDEADDYELYYFHPA